MSNIDVPVLLKGMTGGTTSESSVMNVLATQLEDSSRNIEVFRDGSMSPRRGVDFIDISDGGDYMHTTRTIGTSSETSQESPSAEYAAFRTSDGDIIEKDIIFQDNVFKIYNHGSLRNFDTPDQTINPASLSRSWADQKYYSVQLKFADNKMFFASKRLQPGYFYLNTDNSTLSIAYLSIHTRDLDNATTTSSRVTLNGQYYECVEAHTSAAGGVHNALLERIF